MAITKKLDEDFTNQAQAESQADVDAQDARTRLWQSMNRTDRFTLRQLAQAQQPLLNRSQATSTTYSSLLRLMKLGYVVKNEHYEIEDPFFFHWISENNK